MSDVADDIRKTIQGVRSNVAMETPFSDESFRKLKAHVLGTMLDAHRTLTQREGAFYESDLRMIEVASVWMDSLKNRK